MNRKFILIFIGFFLFLEMKGQSIKKIKVPMSLVTKKIPFALSGACMTRIYNGSRNKFKGIPDFLTTKNSIIKTIYFGWNSPLNNMFYLLIGSKDDNNRICIIDTNKDLDFSDDYQYSYNENVLKNDILMPAQPLRFRYSYENHDIERSLYLTPDFHPGNFKYTSTIEQKYFVVLNLSECRMGSFNVEGEKYTLAAAMPTPRVTYDSQTVFSIINSEGKFPSSTNKLGFYKINEPFVAGKSKFKVNNIAPSGDSVYLEYIGSRSLKEIGYQNGFYAPDITSTTLGGKEFSSYHYQGKFVLIDFWGTWCKPCIALIPELRKLHNKYKKLVLVSVACEDKGQDVVKSAVKKLNMNWINLYEPFSGSEPLIKAFEVNTFPTTILIDPTGKIVFRGHTEDFEKLVKLLKEDMD